MPLVRIKEVSLVVLLLATGCDGLWPTDAPYDPRRCDPRCKTGEVCFQGTCVSAQQDGGADLGGPLIDGPAQDGPAQDGPAADGPLPDTTADAPPLDQGPTCVHPSVYKSCKGDLLGMSWCNLPAGCFWMGSPSGEKCRNTSNEDRHPVTLTHSFEIMAAEVTQRQFQDVAGYSPSSHTSCGHSCPVESVSWHEAAAFANTLSALRGLTPCYRCANSGKSAYCQDSPAFAGASSYACPGYRLPTEAEWEYAYRAGGSLATYKGSITSCTGSDPLADTIGWYDKNASSKTHPAGMKEPNKWGLYDMAGNVWEWCYDKYNKSLGSSPKTNPVDLGGSEVTIRGGSFSSKAEYLRGAYRLGKAPSPSMKDLGFRLVRTTDVPGGWVSVKAGTFQMGSPATPVAEPCRDATREDQHQVTLTHDFAIQATEVTQGMFEVLMGYNPSHFGSFGKGANCGPHCPVETVNWHEAAAFCNAMSQHQGLRPCYACSNTGKNVTCKDDPYYTGQKIYTCPGFRLPTEAEWEYAYRAGTSTALYNGKITNCTGADANADKICWYKSNSLYTTHTVAKMTPNAWKIYDMAGNVWEWCDDYFVAKLGTGPVTDPVGPSTGTKKAHRGGCFDDQPQVMRAAYRGNFSTGTRESCGGLRCVRTLNPGVMDPAPLPMIKKTGDQHARGIAFDGTNFLMVWKEGTPSKYRAFASRVSQAGTVWDPNGISLVGGTGQEDNPDVSYNGREYLAVWADKRHGDFDIYGTRLSRDGKVLDLAGIQIFKGSNDQRAARVAFDGTNYLVTWRDDTSPITIRSARVNAGGVVLDTTPIQVSHSTVGNNTFGAVHFSGSRYLVAWHNSHTTSADILGRLVSTSGTLVGSMDMTIAKAANSQSAPAISALSPTFQVVWWDKRNGSTNHDIYGARVQSTTATPLDTSGVQISGAAGVQFRPAISSNGLEHFAIWVDSRLGNADLYGARINKSAQVLDKAGIPIVTDSKTQETPFIIWGSSSYMAIWSDDRNGDWDIYGARVAP